MTSTDQMVWLIMLILLATLVERFPFENLPQAEGVEDYEAIPPQGLTPE